MNSTDRFDVVVMGSGPAGLSAAIMLMHLNRRVLVLSLGPSHRQRIGESLSPAANQILRQLGIWEVFVADKHLPCYGNKSSWGSARLEYFDFIQDPRGHAWHIDRPLFEQRLIQRAGQLGVERRTAALSGVRRIDGNWQLEPRAEGKSLSAAFVVDATGRASWFARRQGSMRSANDPQIALVAFLRATAQPLDDSTSLVEAVPDGWWYSAAIPNGQLATAFFTDFDLIDRRTATGQQGWFALLQAAHFTAARVLDHAYRLESKPRFVPAGSSRLDRMVGTSWLAVGDAAVCYDPLSAHGLTLALASGRDAATAIASAMDGDAGATEQYASRLDEAYQHYARMRMVHYRNEVRWPGRPFWQRRRQNGSGDPAGTPR